MQTSTEFTHAIDCDQMRANYLTILSSQPATRIRNAASQLGISEAQLLALRVREDVIQLDNQPEAILAQIEKLGEVMALTRNDYCVHERKGVYSNGRFFQHGNMKQGLFVNPDIDLRLFLNHWHYCFAVIDHSGKHPRKSLQFFDQSGQAIHKIFLTEQSNESLYDSLVIQYRHVDQDPVVDIRPYAPPVPPKKDQEVDWHAFRNAWSKLKDTHDFHPMLKQFKVGREQAFRHAGDQFAYRIDQDSIPLLLETARDRECEIMVFVGNRGCIQIHTGTVSRLIHHDGWYNVLDPMFNLHLRTDAIENIWVSRKPTVDGIVTAVEVFDKNEELIATFFGKRKPGIAELDSWRQIVAGLAKENRHDA